MRKNVHEIYTKILKEELLDATGCTEPIALALASAKAKKVLEDIPDQIKVFVSDNIIKNAKSVIVPNTKNLKGIKASVAAGIIAGDSDQILGVISTVSNAKIDAIHAYLKTVNITVEPIQSEYIFDIQIEVYKNNHCAKVRMINHHTNIVYIKKNDDVLLAKDYVKEKAVEDDLKKSLTVKDIVDYANTVDLKEIKPLILKQISNNLAISEEGLTHKYGANIGKVLLKKTPNHLPTTAKAKAAAASDARMAGCKLPVTIVSGSGNQGITASLPVITYAQALKVSEEKLIRALLVSNLVTIHQKTGVGPLSAYCGAVFAGAGSGAGIAYLHDGTFEDIAHTIVNALAIVSGVICDGAKASCAAKIATSVDAGILGFQMYQEGQQFYGGDGIIAKGIENTIHNVTRLAREGMRITDKEIVKIMTEMP